MFQSIFVLINSERRVASGKQKKAKRQQKSTFTSLPDLHPLHKIVASHYSILKLYIFDTE